MMNKDPHKSVECAATADADRRTFLKASVAGAAAVALAGPGVGKTYAASEGAWTDGMQINPDIDNLDVVCCSDPAMLNSDMTDFSATGQNSVVNKDVLQDNMDRMAIALVARKKGNVTADMAWRTILRKPATKEWNQVKVAIKANCLEPRNAPRVAVLDKLCRVLNGLGVDYTNIHIFDAIKSATKCYGSLVGKAQWPNLPAGVLIDDSLGGWVSTTVPGFTQQFRCCRFLTDSTIDILIDVAVNKGQPMANMANSTLTMKNHYGTFNPLDHRSVSHGTPSDGSGNDGGTRWLLGISKHDAILGGNPVRQQLCIVDSLVGSKLGPIAIPDRRLDRLVMGTFSPAVDYLAIEKIRKPLLGATYTDAVVNRFITGFGYPAPTSSYDFVEMNALGSVYSADSTAAGSKCLSVVCAGASVHFTVPAANHFERVEIHSIDGKCLRTLAMPDSSGNGDTIWWDGRLAGGGMVLPGRYVVMVVAGAFRQSSTITLSK